MKQELFSIQTAFFIHSALGATNITRAFLADSCSKIRKVVLRVFRRNEVIATPPIYHLFSNSTRKTTPSSGAKKQNFFDKSTKPVLTKNYHLLNSLFAYLEFCGILTRIGQC